MPDTLTRPTAPAHANPAARGLRQRVRERVAVPAWVLLIEVFIGLGWLRAAVEKIIDPAWWSGDVVVDFLADHADTSLPWYTPIEQSIVRPGLGLVLVYVVMAQLAVGLALVAGTRREIALGVGLFLNLNFIAIGAVDPSAFYVLAQLAVLLWVLESRTRPAIARPAAAVGVVAGLVLAAGSAPFIGTLDPALVIEDPAVMLTTMGLLAAVCGLVLLDRPRTQADPCGHE